MANLENNNSENNKPISEKVGEKITDVAEGVKHTIEHPVEAAKETVAQAVEDVQKFSWWAKLFLWFAAIASFLFLTFLIVINLPATKDCAANYAFRIFGRRLWCKNIQRKSRSEHSGRCYSFMVLE